MGGNLMKKDDAVSPVIALMLILAILATCLAVYTTTYVPGLKQQDEITHSGDVRLTFERFASDIDNLIAQAKPAVYTEVLELGGGDVPLSPAKSSGTLTIEETVLGTYTIGGKKENLTGIRAVYLPSFTAWEKQGYRYENGLVWVTKEEKKTPAALTLYTIQDGLDAENTTLLAWYANGASVIPRFTAKEKQEISGTSAVKLRLNATVSDIVPEATVKLAGGTDTTYTNFRWLTIEVSLE